MKPSILWAKCALLLLLPTLSGCATILRGTGQGIGIATQPPGAEVTVDNKVYGVSPVSVKLRRKDNHHIVVRMEGYEPYEIMLTRQTSGWVFGNILFSIGAPIGLAVDAIAGGMYSLTPDQVNAQLQVTTADNAQEQEGMLYVVLVPEADSAWEKVGQLERSRAGNDIVARD
jgi:hypothetical protein